ncbi:type III secretion protein [Pseudomonas sp. 910_23]|nr:type III secretion protein [Pseudomonas fluorescens]MCK3839692.1 type III secretion protein [Pseudomonas sp. NCIMB 10586]MCK3843689.1 type III secretion protein [Pseudomonas sp. W15Feb34]MCK3850158.1 type III secretion protein [Pseudomonas sp. W2Jun17]MCK3862651.1 type III secretion protein [Pseudomonas sp. B329]OPB09091.1 type III secretion protein [Pseudomonas synxantha]
MINIDAIRNMLAMVRAHQALERQDALEQARNKSAGSSAQGCKDPGMIKPPDEDTDRPINFS